MKTKKKLNRYYWNGNAPTHSNAVVKFGMMSTVPATLIAMAVVVLGLSIGEKTRDFIMVMTAVGCIVWVSIWATMLLSMSFIYHSLIESQIASLPHPTEVKVKEVPFYQTDTGWVRGGKGGVGE